MASMVIMFTFTCNIIIINCYNSHPLQTAKRNTSVFTAIPGGYTLPMNSTDQNPRQASATNESQNSNKKHGQVQAVNQRLIPSKDKLNSGPVQTENNSNTPPIEKGLPTGTNVNKQVHKFPNHGSNHEHTYSQPRTERLSTSMYV